MSDTEFENQTIDDEKIARLRAIFDLDKKLVTDEDLLDLAELVEDESDENDIYIDRDFDFGSGG